MNIAIWVDYTNYRGVREWREIIPLGVGYGEYFNGDGHGAPVFGHLLHCQMLDRGNEQRSLNMMNIHGFATEKPEASYRYV